MWVVPLLKTLSMFFSQSVFVVGAVVFAFSVLGLCVFIQSFCPSVSISLILSYFFRLFVKHIRMVCSWAIGNYFKRYWFVSPVCVFSASVLFRLNSECWEWVSCLQTESVYPFVVYSAFFLLSLPFYLTNSQMGTCCFPVNSTSYNRVSMYAELSAVVIVVVVEKSIYAHAQHKYLLTKMCSSCASYGNNLVINAVYVWFLECVKWILTRVFDGNIIIIN